MSHLPGNTGAAPALNVLVLGRADDDGPVAALERGGDKVSRVESLEAAIEAAGAGAADVVLVDVTDEAAALGACTRLRAASGGHLPIVARAAGAEAAEELEEAGADLVLPDAGESEREAHILRALARLHVRARHRERGVPARTKEIESLRRFTDELVAQLPSRLFVVDEDMCVLFANRTALADTGTEGFGALGRPFAELMPAAEEGGPIWSAIRGVIERGSPERILGLHARAGGGQDESVFNVSVHPSALAGHKCARVIVDDVTDEWLAEQGRVRETRKLEDVVSAMGAGLATVDGDRIFTWANRTFEQWFGVSTGWRCSEVFVGDRCGEADCPAVRTLEFGTSESETWRRYAPDGQRRTFQSSFARVAETDGAPSLIVLVQDVTPQADRIEQVELVGQLSRSIQGLQDLDELLHVILTCVTAGHALGFNRAFLFLRNRRRRTLEGRMAVGPGSGEEAYRVWADLAARHQSLEDALREARSASPRQSPLFGLIRDVRYPLHDPTELPVRVFREKRSALVKNAASDRRVTRDFRNRFGSTELVAVPLVSKGESLGVIVADNLYNDRPIDRNALALLETFAGPAGLAIGNAEAFADLRDSLDTLKRTRQQLIDQTKLAAVGRLAAHVAHEIRNPLATIGGFAHSIRSHAEERDRVRDNAGIIYEEVHRLERMLSGIMDFSRPSRPVLVRQSLNSVVERAVGMLTEQFAPKVRITITLDPDTPEVAIDAGQTRQVLINVVRNAAESMTEAGGRVLVCTHPREDDGARLVIEDDGPGIPQDLKGRIFEPFFTTKKGGTGLGLAVCRQIVAEHGGRMGVESVEGHGARFLIEFPPKAPEQVNPDEAGLS
jgi:signal transduction histidine kinase